MFSWGKLLILIAFMCLFAPIAASAQSKEQIHEEMISIAHEINALKGDPAATGELEQLRAQYVALSASLGGDDPGALAGAAEAPAGAGGGVGAGVVPPNCASDVDDFASTDTPLPITDLATTTSTITVSGLDSYLADLNITTNISHTFPGDLDITVTSPAGTVITLTTDNGGTNDNAFGGTVWDDDGGDSNPPGAVSDNVYANLVVETPLVAEEALGAFIGENPNGDWEISVTDDTEVDTGTLNSWALNLTTLGAAPVLDPPVSVASTDTPLPITDLATTMSAIAFAGANTFACGVNLTTDISHTFPGDLDITVTSAAGTVITLTTDNGGTNDNAFGGTVWDDDGGDSNPPGAVSDNVYANLVVETPLVAEEALSAFIGEDPNGSWQISVTDDTEVDTGTLNSWAVDVTTCECELPASATFPVEKFFNDGNPAEVEVTISCNTGLPLEQSTTISEGDGVVFVVVDFEDGAMDCEITETAGADGYATEYAFGATTSDESCVFEGVTFGSSNVCELNNTLQAVDVEVSKVWIDENPQFAAQNIADAEWECSNVASGSDNGLLQFFGNPGGDSFSVFPDWESGTTCSVTEVDLNESGVEVDDSDCQGLVLVPGAGASCTIVNTRLYEGIPTLGQYGLALLAMLMLGIGFVAFRRTV